MKKVTGIVLIFLLLTTAALAAKLEVKVDQNSLKLPYWQSALNKHYGAVVIVNGGEKPQWSALLAQFAKQLSHSGWSVVLLNCNMSSVPWIKQVPEVISTLRQDNNKRIILVHYGNQLNQSLDYFSQPQAKMVNGLVLVSAYDVIKSSGKSISLRFPLFDIAGQFDYEMVLDQMNSREQLFNQTKYASLELPGANHDYAYSSRLLLAFMHGWMLKLPEYHPAPAPILASYIEPVPVILASYIEPMPLILASYVEPVVAFNSFIASIK